MKASLAGDYFDFRRQLLNRGVIFCYSGILTEDVLASVGSSIRRRLEMDGAERRLARSVFSAFVELVQNVIRYSAEGETFREGVLLVGRTEEGTYFVGCSNVVSENSMAALQGLLGEIRGKDRKELTTLLKDRCRTVVPEGSKGAGVGFISMAREAKGFEFDFMPVDESGAAFFSFEAHF